MPIDKSLKTESSEFRLFRCDHGCFHLEWKYFAIVHMTAEHLLRLYQQLVGVCDRSSAVEQACEAGCVCLECNDDIQIKLKRTEAVVPMAQVGAFRQMQSHNKTLGLALRDVEKPLRSKSIMRLLRKLHSWIGIVSSLNLLLLITTGLLIQHSQQLGLEDKYVSRRFLPSSYRLDDGPMGVRSDIVVTDLHSGKFIGKTGALLLDGLTLAWLALLVSGVLMFRSKYRRGNNNHDGEGRDNPANLDGARATQVRKSGQP